MRFQKIAKSHYSIHLKTGEKIGEAKRDPSRPLHYIGCGQSSTWYIYDLAGNELGAAKTLEETFAGAYDLWRKSQGLGQAPHTIVSIAI